MSYANPSQMSARYDVRRLGQLVRDDGTTAGPAQLATDANLQAALDDGSGMIDAACLQGGRYLPTDLTGLAGTAQAFLIRLNCDLAYGYLVGRRGFTTADAQAAAPGYTEALRVLEALRQGELIFNVAAAINAGKPQNVVIDAKLTLISSTSRLFGDLTVDPNNPGFAPPNQ
jgi:phage gp36-like protein